MKSHPPLFALLIMSMLIAAYGVAYFGCATKSYEWRVGPKGRDRLIERVYCNEWVEMVFEPAAWLESTLRSGEVQAVTLDDESPEMPIL